MTKIYLDMDGVLADFDRGVNVLCGMQASSQAGKDDDPDYDNRMWEAIRNVDHFYDKLELIPGARDLFERIWSKYGKQCEILTGIPKPKRGIVTAGDDKKAWAKRLLSEDLAVNVVFREQKPIYCEGKGSILIDDRESNIREWQELGGTGILHVSAEETVRELEKLGVL